MISALSSEPKLTVQMARPGVRLAGPVRGGHPSPAERGAGFEPSAGTPLRGRGAGGEVTLAAPSAQLLLHDYLLQLFFQPQIPGSQQE